MADFATTEEIGYYVNLFTIDVVLWMYVQCSNYQGRIQDFPKGGVETRDTKCLGGGGGGGVVASGPIRKAGGGGGVLSALGPTQKAKKRGGGGGGLLSGASGPIQKAGRGFLAVEGAVPYMKGGVATPKTPPLDPPLNYTSINWMPSSPQQTR